MYYSAHVSCSGLGLYSSSSCVQFAQVWLVNNNLHCCSCQKVRSTGTTEYTAERFEILHCFFTLREGN